MKIPKKILLAGASLLMAASLPVTRADIITTNQTLAGTGQVIDGTSLNGAFVLSGTTNISNVTLSNFTATGGTGSGGGAGMGGAVFVNTGATVILNNVSFLGNQAVGGNANALMTTGGSLNGLFIDPSAAAAGLPGSTPSAQHYLDPNGTTGTNGANGTSVSSGLGGLGGRGGNGGNGDAAGGATAYILDVTSASLNVAALAATIVGASQPFTASEVPGLVLQAAQAGVDLGSATAALVYYDKAIQSGQLGVGGDGGAGGNAGASGFGFGGVAGGAGGNGGNGTEERSGSAFNGGAAGGNGGDGGQGGLGGFGSGGGSGGNGGSGGQGAHIGASAAVAAVAAVTQTVDVPATYEKGYYWDNDNNPSTPNVWVQLEGKLGTNPTTVAGGIDPDGSGPSPAVDIVGRVQTAATTATIILTPAQDAIAATSDGSRPDGVAGAGGAGGNGGFGAGTGTSGSGSNTQIAGGNGGDGLGGAIFVRSGGTLIIGGNAVFGENDARGGDGAAGTSSVAQGASGTGIGTDLFIMKGSSVTLAPGAGNTIVFNGSIADDSATSGFSGSIAAGNGAGLTITAGTVIFNGTNTYSGTTNIAGGVLQAFDGIGVNAQSHLKLDNGGIFQSSGVFTRRLGTSPSQIEMGSSSGFAAQGGNLRVTLSSGAQLTWAAGSFVTGSLVFGSDSADAAVNFTNAINFNGAGAKILVTDNANSDSDFAVMTGVLSNGSLTVGDSTHTGLLRLDAANTYAGGTTLNGGTLLLGSAGSLSTTGAITVNAGTFDLSLANSQTLGSLSGTGGRIALGSKTLTLNQSVNGSFAGVIADGGLNGGSGANLVKQGSATLTLTGANTYSGDTHIVAGTLTLGTGGSLASKSILVDSGTTLNNTVGGLAAIAAVENNGTINLGSTDDTVASLVNTGTINGTSTLTAATYKLNQGSVINANLGAGVVTTTGTVALNGTSSAATVTVSNGVLTLGSAERLLDTADVTVDGKLVLGGAEKIGSLSGASTGEVAIGAGNLTVSSGTFAGIVTSTSGTTELIKVDGGELTLSGNSTYTGRTHVVGGTLTLSGTGSLESKTILIDSGTTLNNTVGGFSSLAAVENNGTLNLGSTDDTVASLVNTGTINGTSTLTAATYGLNQGSVINANLGAGVVTTTGEVALNGTSSAATVTVSNGVLTLGSAERLLDTASVTVNGKLVLGGDERIKTLLGSGEVAVDAGTLTASDGNFSGVISGTHTTHGLIKESSGTLTLSGANTYLGDTEVKAGTLTLTGSLESRNVGVDGGATLNDVAGGLSSNAIVYVGNDSNGPAILNLGADDTVAAIIASGTINGAATLNAAVYGLGDGAIVNANLGAGVDMSSTDFPTLVSSYTGLNAGGHVVTRGNVLLNGTSAAAQVDIQSGVLTLGSAERLLDTVIVNNDGKLVLGGDEKIGTLNGTAVSEVAIDAGSLTVSDGTYAGVISGSTPSSLNKVSTGTLTLSGANTFTGATNVDAGTLELTGSLTGVEINVASGATLNDANGGLNSLSEVTADGLVKVGADQTIKTLLGTGEVALTGGILTVSDGSFSGVVSGTSDAYGLVKTGADALTLSGANTYVGATSVNAGTLTLTGSLTTKSVSVASVAVFNDVNGGLVDTVELAVDGTANLGADETVTKLTGSGTVNLDTGSLTVSNGSFSGVIAGADTAYGLTKVSSGELTLSGANTYAGATAVNEGTLTLTGSLASGIVNVASGATLNSEVSGLSTTAALTNNGTINLGSGNQTVGSLVNSGTINGSATLTAATYTLNTASVVNANLGAGTLTVAGEAILAGTSAATTVDILVGGKLTLASAERLSDDAVVNLGGTLELLGGNETIKQLNGSGTLLAGVHHLTVTDGGNFSGNVISTTSGLLTSGDLTLTGDSSFSGPAEVKDGNLTVTSGGTLSSTTITVYGGSTLTVDSSSNINYSTLNGAGTVTSTSGTFVNQSLVKGTLTFTGDFTNYGTLAPGNSPGVTTILGNYTEAGTLQTELGGTTPANVNPLLVQPNEHDQIRVTGTITVQPTATLVIQGFNNFVPARGDVFQILADSAGNPIAVNGSFGSVLFDLDGVAGSGVALANAAFILDTSTGRLTATGLNNPGSKFSDLGKTDNQRVAAGAIFAAAQIAPNQIDATTTRGFFARQIADAAGSPESDLAFFVPDTYGALLDYGRATASLYNSILEDRVGVFAPLPTTDGGNGSVFGGARTSDTDTNDRARYRRDDYYAGVDVLAVKGFTFGVIADFNTGRIDHDVGTTKVEGVGGGVYVKADLGEKFTAFGAFGYTGYDYDITRRTLNGVAKADASGHDYLGDVGVRYLAWSNKDFSIAPRVALTYSHTEVGGFTESGAIDSLNVDGFGSDRLAGQAGASGVWTTRLFGQALSVELTAAIEQKLVDDQDAMDVNLVNAQSIRYPVEFADEGKTAFIYGVNVGYNVYGPATIYVGYQGRTGGNDANNFNAGVRVRF